MSESDELSRPADLVDALRWRAAHRGDEEAYTFLIDGETEEASLTYRELDVRARGIGARLQSLGDVGERALLLCPAGLDYVAGFFGCMYAGFVAVPAYAPDPRQHVETLHSVAQSSQPLVGITTRSALPAIQQAFADDLELARLSWLCVDEIPAGMEREWREPNIGLDDLAYLVYTSGSTSVPKGVMLTYRNFPPTHKPMPEPYRGGERRGRIVSWVAPHVGAGITQGLIGPLTGGIPISFMAPEAFSERPARWIEAISRTRATHSSAPNFAYDLMVDAIPPEERRKYDLSNWQFAFNGGEQARAETIERFEAAFAASGLQPGTVMARYGMSEARGLPIGHPGKRPAMPTFDQAQLEEGAVEQLDEGDERGIRLVSLGVPTPDTEILIVDPATRRKVEPNRVGEVWIRGALVTAGYWNNSQATRDAFAHLAEADGGPYFRTGDLGFLCGGELFLAGRLKELVIVRGRNISSLGIELAAQKSHPALHTRAGAAFSVDEEGEERLIIVHEVDGVTDLGDIARAVRRTVAREIGVQAHAVVLVPPDSIPRTAIGKIRRAACKEAFLAAELPVLLTGARGAQIAEHRASYVAPATPLESALAGIWERVLGVSPVGVHDDFGDLGGDSLRSLQVLARMRERGIHATVDQIRHHGTIAALAEAIDAQPATQSDEGPLVGPVPMLLTNYSVLGDRPEPPDDLVLIQAFTTTERLDPEILDRAAKHVVFHHDALRMRFTFTGTGWEAACVAHLPNRIVSYIDLSAAPVGDHDSLVLADAMRLRGQIDIRQGPMLLIGLFHLGSGLPDRLMVFVPHVASDAFCSRILSRDLETAYLQLRAGQSVSLPARTTSIRRWGEKIRELAASDELRAEISFWLDVFDVEPAVIPPDLPWCDDAGGAIHAVWSSLGTKPTRQLLRISLQRDGFQAGDAFLSAAARGVSTRTGSHSLLIDTLGHGREPLAPDIDVSRTLGYFSTHIPVRLDLDPSAAPAESAASVRAQLERIPRHGIGFDILRYLCNDPLCRWFGRRNRLIEVNYAGVSDGMYDGLTLLQATSAVPGDASRPSPRTDHVRIRGMIMDGSLYVGIEYHDRVYKRATAEQLIARILEHLEEIAVVSSSGRQLAL